MFLLSVSVKDLATASSLALEMAALIVRSDSVPWISLIIAVESLEVMVYRVRALNAKASGCVP